MELIKLINCEREEESYRFEKSGGELLYKLERKLSPADKFLIFDFENQNPLDARLEIHFYKKEDLEKPRFSIILAILPDLKTPVVVPLVYLNGQSMNGAARQGILCTAIDGMRLAIEAVDYIGIYMSPCHIRPLLSVSNVRIAASDADLTYDFTLEGLVDEFGQYKGRDWPGKTYDLAELQAYLRDELAQANDYLDNYEDSYLGTGEADYQASGYFRIESAGNQKFMITPDGRKFTGFGCTVVLPNSNGPLGNEPNHDYLFTNMQKVWGAAAFENWSHLTKYRLLKWGMNTVAAWSSLEFAQQSKLPYTVILDKAYPTTTKKIYRDFPDVFSKEYQERAAEYATSLEKYQDDPYVIGYFMTNEPHWAFVRGLNLGYECLLSTSQSKSVLMNWLKKRFGTIKKLNLAFKSDFQDFDELENITIHGEISDEAKSILDEFTDVLIREYVRVPAEALRNVDPKHLNLGMRYAFISSDHLFAGSEFMDVYSINCYNVSAVDNIERIYAGTGLPVMIGEFHFGALDRGLPATGIQGVATQKERGRAIHDYVVSALGTGHCVGVHHFQLNDEPYLGRFDGENYNIGLVDICNREYEEVTEEFKPIQHIPAIFF